jgi:hypothetical protein
MSDPRLRSLASRATGSAEGNLLYGTLPAGGDEETCDSEGTRIEDPFSVIDPQGQTLGVVGPPGDATVTNSPNDTSDIMRGIETRLGTIQSASETGILSGDFCGGASPTNLIWVSHGGGGQLTSALFGGPGISSEDMASAISNAYNAGGLTGRLNAVFVGCYTDEFVHGVYNGIAPAYRSFVTLVGASGLIHWSMSGNYLEIKGWWYRYP